MRILFILIICLQAACTSAVIRSKKITVSGTQYEVIEHRPSGKGPHPLLIIAPAKKYMMTGPIFKKLADGAKELGYFSVRFNWGFVTDGSDPSADLSREAKDLENVINHYKNQEFINNKNVIIVAKSFGTRVAMLGPHSLGNALLLMTPNCDKENTFKKNYSPIFQTDRSIHIVISKDDPYCDVTQIHKSMGLLGKNMTIHTLFGDHNFVTADERSSFNEDSAIQSSLNWLNMQQ